MEEEKDSKEIVLEQWKTCVESANIVSQRRDTMNNLFVTLNIAIIAAISVVFNIKTLLLIFAGIFLCIVWLFLIRNFKVLNREKFNYINQMEQDLIFQPFSREWESLKGDKTYIEETKLEKFLPIIFIILYIVAAFMMIIVS